MNKLVRTEIFDAWLLNSKMHAVKLVLLNASVLPSVVILAIVNQ